jgi:hypothetical protein
MKVSFRLYGCDSKVRLHLDSVGTKKKKKWNNNVLGL